jgi:hypothetical protein
VCVGVPASATGAGSWPLFALFALFARFLPLFAFFWFLGDFTRFGRNFV